MVDNQHKKISGYRDLTEDDIATINRLKQEEAVMLEYFNSLAVAPNNIRSMAIAKTELQTAFMWAIRAVARPNGE